MRKLNFSQMITLCALCLCTLAACIDHEPECDICDEIPDGRGILLSFDLDDNDEQTRSTLQSSEVNYKDVKEVYLYVFEGANAQAQCIHAEPVGWKGEITQEHWVKIDLEKNKPYTFMAVGVDNKAETVYGFPGIIQAKTESKAGTTLEQCMAQLQENKGKDDMAHTQFFVGSQSRTVTSDVEEVALTLRRKVAGILVYLRNIPVNVTYKEKKCRVNTLEVRLHQPQHTSLKLYSNGTNPIYGEGSLTDSDVLFSLDLSENTKSGFKPDTEERYFVKAGNDSVLADSYLAGAYLLPIAKNTGSPTLSVNLRGDYTDGAGKEEKNTVLKTYEVRYKAPKNPETPETPQKATGVTDFNIQENTLYSIGKKLSNSSTNDDKPADLSGNLLELQVMPWRKLGSTHTFPTVVGPARIEPDYNDSVYVMDANQNSFVITIKPAVDKDPNKKKQWTLSVNYGDDLKAPDDKHGNKEFGELPKDWIHFKAYDSEGKFVGYKNTLTGLEEQEVTVVINDYAVVRKLQRNIYYTNEEVAKFKNDIRRAVLELKTEEVTEPYLLQVQQYNTLTITTNDQYQNPRGITRLDYGCWFDKKTGKLMGREEKCKIKWGYFETGNLYIVGSIKMNYNDGEINSDKSYNRWKKENWGDQGYIESAIQKITKRFIHLETDPNTGEVIEWNPANENDHTKEKNWYLPAYYEMWGVSKTADSSMVADKKALYELINMQRHDVYWTSSGHRLSIPKAYITTIGKIEAAEDRNSTNYLYKTDSCFARPMIQFYKLTKPEKTKQ